METRANYILIGAFTLAGILGAFGFFLWLAKFEVSRQYAYYNVLFDNVSGLSAAGGVSYNGLPVGQVISLNLDDEHPSKVRVRIEVDASIPVTEDTVAQLQSLGVTGVSYVELTGGSASAKRLEQDSLIKSKRSTIQSLFEGAPKLLEKAITLIEDIDKVVDDKNRQQVSQILENVSSATGRLDKTLADFENLSSDLGGAAKEISAFSKRLEKLADTAETTLEAGTNTLNSLKTASDTAVSALDSAKDTFDAADRIMQQDLQPFIERASTLADHLTVLTEDGRVALATVSETFVNANKTLGSVTGTMETAKGTLTSAERAFDSANEVINKDIGVVMDDVRNAANQVASTVTKVTDRLDDISADILSASKSASELLGTIDGIVQDNRRQLSDFMRVGLPQFTRFIEESQRLVISLDRLVDKVERDPARFLLGTQASEYRQ
ncbi:MlaD family protein [Ruegeria faecimaris]|uniref:Phospholipid/cholesterol/gamma-HCH transport system substrate-binding protein n=1 Tax=Ruegeria faecimaris TaxID=686389 RepID=A0A521CUR1_9RHOB|nr:MlaD family protein [Ruegeria faecimaris]SMO63186.1 phospholipid/cholesterol/gamma-HCH transport system substrate-binding protein [Ruegeria faecimaris]